MRARGFCGSILRERFSERFRGKVQHTFVGLFHFISFHFSSFHLIYFFYFCFVPFPCFSLSNLEPMGMFSL